MGSGLPCSKYHDPPGSGARPGQLYDPKQDCRLCWLYLHRADYRRLWGGPGEVHPLPPGHECLPGRL